MTISMNITWVLGGHRKLLFAVINREADYGCVDI